MNELDLLQNKKIRNLVIAVTVIGGIVGIMTYIEQRKYAKVKEEIMALDREIKELQLKNLKAQK